MSRPPTWLAEEACVSRRTVLRATVGGVLLALLGCAPGADDDPQAAYDRFLEEVEALAEDHLARRLQDESFARRAARLLERLPGDAPALRQDTRFGALPVDLRRLREEASFELVLFALQPGQGLPLHDHPGMTGVLRVLSGSLDLRHYQRLDGAAVESTAAEPVGIVPVLSSRVSAGARPISLTPARANLHELTAHGPVHFLDVMSPPYGDGRQMTYYALERRDGGLVAVPREPA